MNCPLCGQELDPTKPHFKQIQGWVEDRGSAGGTNHVRDKRYTGKFAHRTCVLHKAAPALFDERVDLEALKKERWG